jgi:2-polyprenyl-3-methyl-5-hydroxy-6-metoxy-1,4-benzoquinol methylase
MAYVYPDVVRDDILRMIPPDGRVIGSVGCGCAATESVLVQQGRLVHGVDIAPEAISFARTRLTSATLVTPGQTLPFAPASLDGLILADVLEHLPQAWEVLQQYAEYIRPGGWVVISVPNMLWISAFYRYAIRGDWPEQDEGIFDKTHLQFMTHRRLERWCSDAGLVVERRFDSSGFITRHRKLIGVVLEALTLFQLHNWWQARVQVRCRRPCSNAGNRESK